MSQTTNGGVQGKRKCFGNQTKKRKNISRNSTRVVSRLSFVRREQHDTVKFKGNYFNDASTLEGTFFL